MEIFKLINEIKAFKSEGSFGAHNLAYMDNLIEKIKSELKEDETAED